MGHRRDLAIAIAGAEPVTAEGVFHRHVSERWRELSGSTSGGRWGPPGTFSVLYLGRPTGSVVVEAYRHLVDPLEGMTGDMVQPRRLLEITVRVHEVLDLRDPATVEACGLAQDHLSSDVGDYEHCWSVARAAHQLGLHGILAPAATGLGDTLAVFEQHLTPAELPQVIAQERWDRLPADPRRLRIVRRSSEQS